MGNGGVRDSLRIQILSATTSTSPVGIFGFTVSGVRRATRPSIATTYSERSNSAFSWTAGSESVWKTACATPSRSRT